MKVCVFTSTRADFGILRPLLLLLKEDSKFELTVLISGSHLIEKFGNTQQEVKKNFSRFITVDLNQKGDKISDVAKAMGDAVKLYSDSLSDISPELVIILGDRFEALSFAIASLLNNIPIAHIHGGELTEGAIDDAFRHSITKMAAIHFPAAEEYRNRIIQMGEQPASVFNTGALAAENILKLPLLNTEQLSEDLKFDLTKPYFLITYHPETLEGADTGESIDQLILSLGAFPEYNAVITYPNADSDHDIIIKKWNEYKAKRSERVLLTESLGSLRYLSCLKSASAVIGNSSSAIIEAPILSVPTLNIGNRQTGRIQCSSIVNAKPDMESIIDGIKKALSLDVSSICHPYGDGNTSNRIVKILKESLSGLALRKKFYDLNL